MDFLTKKLFPEIKMFLTRQYFVIFFMVFAGLKLCYFPNMIGFNYTFYYMRIGYVFSMLAAIVLFTPLIFVRKFKKPLSFTLALTISLILLVDLAYYRFFKALPTFGLLDAINQTKDISSQAPVLFNWTDLILVVDLVIFLLFEAIAAWAYKAKWVKAHKEIKVGILEKVFLSAVVLALVGLFYIFNYLPIPKQKLSDAVSWSYETRRNVQLFGLFGGHMIDGYRFVDENIRKISPAEKTEVLTWVKQNMKTAQPKSKLHGSVYGKRIIMVQAESLSNFVVGKKIEGQAVTPNLNQLAEGSHYFADTRFIFGAGHTSDTDLVANTSLYPLYDSSAFVRYGKDDYTGVADLLAESGYKTSAYHAYNRNFWNRNVALKALGYDRFLAAESFRAAKGINMDGLADKDFFEESFEYVKAQPVKSLSYAITLSSHFPFHTYAETSGLKINNDDYPAFVAGYLQNINYTDQALGIFLNKLRAAGIYDDSLIVVYGDHNPTISDFKTESIGYSGAGLEAKQVPLLIKLPGQIKGQTHSETVTTQDIAPTILDLVGLDSQSLMFGQSLFGHSARCDDGFVRRPTVAPTCAAQVEIEKRMTAKIIKYNLFSELFR